MGQTQKVFLYAYESFGEASYMVTKIALSESFKEYKFLGEIEVPEVSEETLRELALGIVDADIAKTSLVMKALNEKKQQLLSLTHEVK